MKWALPQIQNKLMTGIWGNIHQQVQQSNGTQVLKRQEELSQNVTTYDDTEVTSDAQALRGEVPAAAQSAPAVQPAADVEKKETTWEEQKEILKEASLPLSITNSPEFAAGEWVADGLIKIGKFVFNIFSEEGQEKLQKQLDSLGK